MNNVVSNARYWIAGTLAALVGVVLARWLAPAFATGTARVGLTVGGQLLALAGLVVLCVGVNRRVRHAPDLSTPSER